MRRTIKILLSPKPITYWGKKPDWTKHIILLGWKSETLCQFMKATENILADSFDNMRAQTKLKWFPFKKIQY